GRRAPRLHARGAGLEHRRDPPLRAGRLQGARDPARLLHGQPRGRPDHVEGPAARRGGRLGVSLAVLAAAAALALGPQPPNAPLAQSLCFADPAHGWLAQGGTVFSTSDGGGTWRRVALRPSRQGYPIPALGCRDSGVWIVFHEGAGAGTEGYEVYRSLDGGRSWREVLATPCAETAAALIEDGAIRANVVASQADLHARYGGVVPEVASRRHLELVTPVIREALDEAGATLDDVTQIAVTQGPGLIGALLV